MNRRLSPFWAFITFLFAWGLMVPSFAVTSDQYYQAGLSLYQKGNYTQATQYLRAAVQVDPSNWQANQVLGYAYYKINDRQSALASFDQSLQAHPDNPSLKNFADQIRASTYMPPPVTSATAPPPGSGLAPSPTMKTLAPAENETVFRTGKWTNFHVGPVFATLGDFKTGADTVNKNASAINGSATNDSLGILLGAEGGYCFDNRNAISLALDLGFFGGYKDQFGQGLFSGTDSFTPLMGAVEVKYSRFIPVGTSRLRLGVGPGLYFTSLQVAQTYSTNNIVTGPMSGIGFGGSLSLSFEIYLAPNFMLNLFGEGRFASTSNIQGEFQDQAGNTHQVGLVMDTQNYLGTAYTSFIGTNGLRWATVDYTGGDLGIGLSYRY